MTNAKHALLSQILTYVLNAEERHYEESGMPEDHIYNVARSAWVEFELDHLPKTEFMLPELIEHTRKEYFTPEYQEKATDQEILGLVLARHFKWDGRACFDTLTHALEDSNYHRVNRALSHAWHECEGGNV